MELRQLQTFVTITQTESFSRAAEILGYSRPAVTVEIRLLGEEKYLIQIELYIYFCLGD